MQFKRVSIREGWPVAAGLLALSAIPVAAGVVPLVSLATGETVTLANTRFFAHPLPVQLHIVGASLFCILGALQFWPGFRLRLPRWHRLAGRIAAPADIVAGLSGLWMNQFYPYGPHDGLPGELPRALLTGGAWVLNLAVAEWFIRKQADAAFGAPGTV